MQIVRDLAGYTLGRSDLVRRAMSKKKQAVMEKERANFIYGNPEENVPGCIANGIDEQTAGQIYDTMMDFAKYALVPCGLLCGGGLSDGVFKILLSRGVHGCADDLRHR